MSYNLTISGSGFVPLMQTANNIVNGYLGIGFLIMYVIIMVVLTKNYQSKRGFLAASFFGMILSVFFRLMGILSEVMMYASFALFVLAIIWIYMQED